MEGITYLNISIFLVFRGLEIARTWTRSSQMHSQKAQTKPKTKNAVHDAAAVIAREKVSRETVPDDSRKSRILVVPPPYGNTGETCKQLILLVLKKSYFTHNDISKKYIFKVYAKKKISSRDFYGRLFETKSTASKLA